MARVYRIEQNCNHVVTVRAEDLAAAIRYADELGDDGFADQTWGDTDVVVLPKKITKFDRDITMQGEG